MPCFGVTTEMARYTVVRADNITQATHKAALFFNVSPLQIDPFSCRAEEIEDIPGWDV